LGRPVTFERRDISAFVGCVNGRVSALFGPQLRAEKANVSMAAKTMLLLVMGLGAYALVLSSGSSAWEKLALSAVLGVCVAGIGFCVAHDALHGAYSSRPCINALLGYTFDLCGASGYMWKLTHNGIHHTYTNVHGLDEDLTVSPLLRLSPHAPWHPVHRYQHLYAFFAYSLSTLFWVLAKDYKYFFQRNLGPYAATRHPIHQWIGLFAWKAVYYAWSIAIPLMVLNVAWWQFALGWLTMHLVAGALLGTVFQLAHVVEETSHPLAAANGKMNTAWLVHQMETTSNFGSGNTLLTWFVGGLNHQIEHHLFPRICSVHYPAISHIVRAAAQEHGIRYNEHATFSEAIVSHYRTLRSLGSKPDRAAGDRTCKPESCRTPLQHSRRDRRQQSAAGNRFIGRFDRAWSEHAEEPEE
jgi:linoleoyl-CoA desaturase